MSRSLLLIMCLVIGLLVLACGGPTNKNGVSTNRAAEANSSAATASPVATVANATQVGVPECDNFINAYESCVTNKVPAQARAQYQTAVNTWRTQWKKLADNPQTRAGLVTACKQQMEAARTSMKAYNCTF